MPTVKTITSVGTDVTFAYTISTPTSGSVSAELADIDPALPIAIFLHPVYHTSTIFQPQFADSCLRQFNLIAYDCRGHGETEGVVGTSWSYEEAAEDLFVFMEALHLPPCHIFGESMGALVGLQFAASHPDKVASLFLVAPLPFEESDTVAEGRMEICEYWAAGFTSGQVDESALLDALMGTAQLGFNNSKSRLVEAMCAHVLSEAKRVWGADMLDVSHRICVEFFVKRKRQSDETLARLKKCPIKMIYCTGDIAYPVEDVREVFTTLQAVGVEDIDFVEIEGGSHFGNLTHFREINPIFYDFIVRHTAEPIPSSGPLPPPIGTPFDTELMRFGWVPRDDDGTDSDISL